MSLATHDVRWPGPNEGCPLTIFLSHTQDTISTIQLSTEPYASKGNEGNEVDEPQDNQTLTSNDATVAILYLHLLNGGYLSTVKDFDRSRFLHH
ncbi:hypothetical protein M514_19670 [Trichuris suis]|uniref:Uncharacterized protein n=1 Tax=Trichuris suis TaxID=68888 RepID=A0A085NFE2_9BILA|nr:hypothetical protein M514_19670 [Trichuris suis]